MLASDDLTDIVQYNWGSYPGGPEAALKDQYIYKLNDIIESYMPGFKNKVNSNEAWKKDSKTDGGDFFSIPMLLEPGILQIAYGPALRSDILAKTGKQLPRTIEQWEEVLRAFKAIGVESPFIGNLDTTVQAFAPGFGVYVGWYKNGDDIVYGWTQPEMKNLLTTLNKWYKEGLIDQDLASIDNKKVQTAILNGDAASTLMWCGSGMGTYLNAEPDRTKFDIAGVQYPAKAEGENSEYGHMAKATSISTGAAISNNCKNVELAARFMDYGFTEEGHNLYNFGIEGESYNWVDKNGEKYPQYTDLILNNPDGLSIGNAMGLYMRSCYNGLMVQDTRYMEQYYPTEQQKMAQEEWLKTNMSEHLLPNLYISTEDSDADANNMAAINTYVKESVLKFITGQESLDNFDKYVEQVEKFGLEESISFRQKAYERYLAR